jgi:type I restriction enzyme S subunit
MIEWKETEIGKIPIEWQVGSFKDDLNVQGRIGWKGYKTSDLVPSGPYVIGGAEIKSNVFLDLSKAQCLRREKYEESPEIKLKNGDVLLVTRGNLGEVGYYHSFYGEGTINPSVIILNAFKGDSKFLFYYLISKNGKANVMSLASGSSVPAIYQANVKELKYPKPPIEEQKRIAELAYSLDLKIDLLHRQNKILEQLAETLFRQWFVEEAEESWEREPLGKYVTIKRGGSPRPIHDYISETGLNWLKISDVTSVDSPFIFEIKEKIKEEGLNKTTFLKKGSLVLSNSATPGIPKILDIDSCIHDGWLHFPQSKFSKEFLYLLFKHIRPELLQMGNGSIFTNLKTDILKEYVIAIPDNDALKEFDEQVKTIFEKLYSNTIQIRTLKQLRDTLLPKLMSGEVRVEIK